MLRLKFLWLLGVGLLAAGALVVLQNEANLHWWVADVLSVVPALLFVALRLGEPFVDGMIDSGGGDLQLTTVGALLVYLLPAVLTFLLAYRLSQRTNETG